MVIKTDFESLDPSSILGMSLFADHSFIATAQAEALAQLEEELGQEVRTQHGLGCRVEL